MILIPQSALKTLGSNYGFLDDLCMILYYNKGGLKYTGPTIDTIVMNPPFGTRKKGADMDFLSSALKASVFCFLFF